MILFFYMKISRDLAIQILKYLYRHPNFYFPFLVVCKEYTPEDDDFIEIEPDEWKMINGDEIYQTFELWENLQNLKKETLKLMAQGFIQKITNNSLEKHIKKLAFNYRNKWKEDVYKSEKIEEYGLNEFIGGKADAYEECLFLIKKYKGISNYENSIFIKYEK